MIEYGICSIMEAFCNTPDSAITNKAVPELIELFSILEWSLSELADQTVQPYLGTINIEI